MNRRDTVCTFLALGVALGPLSARAQQPAAMRRMGAAFNWRQLTPEELAHPGWKAWFGARRTRFESLGWVEGATITFDWLYSDGVSERIPALTAELVRRKVDLIWAQSTASAVAAVRATKTIPIVIAGASAYPVECGLIQSFARPGGNLTGVAFFQGIEVQSKLAQFVREVLPGARRLAWIAIPPDLVTVAGGEFRPEPYYQQIASRLGFELGYFECRKAEDFDAIFAAVNGWRAQAVIVEPAGLGWDARERIAQLAIRSGLPSFFTTHYNVAAGGLLSYAPDLMEVEYQSIGYVDRILRGARPADLPVEMPRKLELTINSKTAMALGLSIPRSLLLRADKVIE